MIITQEVKDKFNLMKPLLSGLTDINDVILFKDAYLKTMESRELPEKYPEWWLKFSEVGIILFGDISYPSRDAYIKDFGHVLLTKSFIKAFAKDIGSSKCLEVMSGNGALSYYLKEYGVDVIPSDNFSTLYNQDNAWHDVEAIDAVEAVKKYGCDVDYVIMSWCYPDDVPVNVLRTMREVNPNLKMIYLGEVNGCNAIGEFWNIAKYPKKQFTNTSSHYSKFEYINDKIILLK